MNILYLCKLASSKGNGIISALNTEINGMKHYANVALYNLGVEIELDTFKNKIFELKKYNDISELPVPFNSPDLVIFEEIYKFDYIKIYRKLLKENIPYIIIPHGSLVKKEQQRKFLKKYIANLLLFNNFIYNAKAIEFLNKQELENSKSFKYQDFIIIPNCLDISEKIKREKQNKSENNFLFIGRYSIYTKGLDLLIKMCQKYHKELKSNNITLNLYGPICKEQLKVIKLVNNFKVDDLIKVNGPLYGIEKENALKNYNYFIQVSRHEGQPMGIIEALNYGMPCIVSYATSFGEYVVENHCGFACTNNIDSIYNAIVNIINLSKAEYKKYSTNATTHSYKDFNIDNVSRKTYEEYKKVVNK